MESRDKAQQFVECYLCQQPVLFFCRRCRTSLCDPCVPIDLRVRFVNYHDIAVFAINDDDETCFCDSHFLNDCSAYCKPCKIPICSVCVSAKHKSHKIYELSYKIKKLLKVITKKHYWLQSSKHELQIMLDRTTKLLDSTNKGKMKLEQGQRSGTTRSRSSWRNFTRNLMACKKNTKMYYRNKRNSLKK